MKKITTLVDREPLGSDYIASKQDFEAICTQVNQFTPTWKTPWFYGPIGLASVAICVSVATVHTSNAKEKTIEPKNELFTQPSVDNTEEKLSVDATIPAVDQKKDSNPKLTEKNSIQVDKSAKVLVDNELEEEDPMAVDNGSMVSANTTIARREVAKDNRFPHIAGYFTGEVPVDILFDEEGIQLREGYKIISYDLNFYNGKGNVVQSYRGNKIPSDLVEVMKNHNVGNMVFITNIKAIDEIGRIFVLPAVNYKLIR